MRYTEISSAFIFFYAELYCVSVVVIDSHVGQSGSIYHTEAKNTFFPKAIPCIDSVGFGGGLQCQSVECHWFDPWT